MMLRAIVWSGMVCTALLAGCDTGESSTGPAAVEHDGVWSYAYTYDNGRVSVVVDSSYCRGGSLVSVADTLWGTAVVGESTMTVTLRDTVDSGTVIVCTRRHERQDSGSGMTGRWLLVSDVNEVEGAEPTEAQVGDWADDTLALDRMIEQRAFVVEIDETHMTASYTGPLVDILLPVAFEDAPSYLHVTLDTAADGRAVTVSGDISAETVYLTFDANRTITVKSSDDARQFYVVWEIPETCRYIRPWFDDFLEENVSFADLFIAEKIGEMVGVLDIAVDKQGHFVVRITGNVNGEVITVTYDGENTVSYTSTNESRSAFTTNRQDLFFPPWIDYFWQANLPQEG